MKQPAEAKKTRNRNRFKALDRAITETMEYCRKEGIVIGSEREAYAWFNRLQMMKQGYATPPQEMAGISAETVKNEFGFHLFQRRFRHSRVAFRRTGGKVIRLRRFLPWGPLGWRDIATTTTPALTDEDATMLATGATAVSKKMIEWTKGCETLMNEAQIWAEVAAAPQQPSLFLSAPETEENTNDDTAE